MLRAARLILPFGDQTDDRMGARSIEFGAVRIGKAQHVATVLDDRQLHPQTDAEVGNPLLARAAHGLNFSLDAINGKGFWAGTPESRRQILRDNAWTVVGIGREDPARVTCAEFGGLPMPLMLVQGELTTPRFHKLVAEQSRCLPTAKVVTIPKAGHPSPVLNPLAFHDAATEFLQP